MKIVSGFRHVVLILKAVTHDSTNIKLET